MLKKNHDNINRYRKKYLTKSNTHLLILKTSSKLGIEVNFLNLIKNIYKNPLATSYLTMRN